MSEIDEAHLIQYPTGHCFSPDCWCEPYVDWVPIVDGKQEVMLVVRHVDWTPIKHKVVLEKRTKHPSWITRILESLNGKGD